MTRFSAKDRTRILIVEDDESALLANVHYFEYLGFVVDAAATGTEARRRARQHRPDVIVCDWQLGEEGDGVALVRELQNRFGTPAILITANSLDALRTDSADLAIERYFRKPVSLAELAAAVDAALDRARDKPAG